MLWRIDLAESANKFLKRVPHKDCLRIKTALQKMTENPYEGDVGKLKGDFVWRRRIGSYRIFFEIYESERIVRVYGIEPQITKCRILSRHCEQREAIQIFSGVPGLLRSLRSSQ